MAGIIPALADCLEALKEEGDQLEERLRKHERYRQELVPLLEIVKVLRRMGQEEEPSLSDQFLKDLKGRLLGELPSITERGGDGG